MIIPELLFFVRSTHSVVNMNVSTGANGNPFKAVREDSIILPFERASSTTQRKSAKSNITASSYCEGIYKQIPVLQLLNLAMCRNIFNDFDINHTNFICLFDDLIEITNTGNNM